MENREIIILAIDDNHDNLITIKALVIESLPHAQIHTALSGEEGIQIAMQTNPDVILLDVVMPEMDGFEVCSRLKADPELCEIPVVFVTALKGDKESRIKGLEAGAEAFLAKPIDESELIAQIRAMAKIKHSNISRKDENIRLANIIAERTRELEETNKATLNLLEDLRQENEARRKIEEDLRNSELRLVRAEIASKSGNWELHLNTSTVLSSVGANKLYGLTKNLSSFDDIKKVPLIEYREMLANAMTNLIEHDEHYDLEFKIKQIGTDKILDIRSIAFYNKEKRIVFGVIQDITEQKQAQEALSKSEALYRSILAASPDDITVSDLEGNIILTSPIAVKLLGIPHQNDLIGKNIVDIIAPEDQERGKANIEAMFNNEILGTQQYKIYHSNGNLITIEINSEIVRNSEGTPTNIVFVTRDVTDRIRIQKELEQSEALYRAIIDASPDMICIANAEGEIIKYSPSALSTFGYSEDDNISKMIIYDLFAEFERERVNFDFQNLLNDIQPGPLEYKCIKKDATLFDIEVKGGLIRDNLGKLSQFVFIGRDITERKLNEKALQQSEEKYRLITEKISDVVWVMNMRGQSTFVSQSVQKFTGYSIDEYLQQTINDRFTAESAIIVKNELEIAFNTYKNRSISNQHIQRTLILDYICKDGSIKTGEVLITPYLDSNGFLVGFHGVTRDITERKKAEDLLLQTHQNYETYFNTIDEFLFVIDLNGNIIHTNETVINRLGYSNIELAGLKISELHPKDRRLETKAIFKQMLLGETDTCAIPLESKSGELISVESKISHGIWNDEHVIFKVSKDVSKILLSEEKFSKLFQLNPSASSLSDIETGKYIEVNAAFQNLLGYNSQDVIDYTDVELGIYSDETKKHLESQIDANGKLLNVETRLFTKESNIKHVVISTQNIGIQDKQYRLTVINDITDRKIAEEALLASEIKYRELMDNSPEGITIYVDGKIAYVNKEACRLMHAENRDQLLGMGITDFIHVDNQALVQERMKYVAMAPFYMALPAVEEKYIRLDKTEFFVEIKAMRIVFDGKHAIQIAGHDITERKIAEAKIMKSETELRNVWENSANGLRLTDEEGNILRVNNSFCDIFEIENSNIDNATVANIYIPKDIDKTILRYKEKFKTRTVDFHVEKEFTLLNGKKKWFQIENSFLDIEGEKPLLLGIFTEITERKYAEEKVRHLTRLYALLSQINQAFVRTKDLDSLFEKICNVAIEYGGFKMAWIGVPDAENKNIIQHSFAGKENGYLQKIKSIHSNDLSYDIFSSDVNTKSLFICNNIATDVFDNTMRIHALERTYRSAVTIPIIYNHKLEATLNLYASEIGFFDADEQKLLLEIAEDIAFAINAIEAERVRKHAEEALIDSENRYITFINNNVDMIFVKDEQFRYLVVNDALANYFGVSKSEMLNKTDEELCNTGQIIPCKSSDQAALKSEVPFSCIENLGDRIFETTKFKMPLKNGKYGVGGILHDTTVRKRSELALEESRVEIKAIYDNAPVIMCVVNQDGNILFQNNEFNKYVSLTETAIKGRRIGDVFGCINALSNVKDCGNSTSCNNCELRNAYSTTFLEDWGKRDIEFHTTINSNGNWKEIYLMGSSAMINSSGSKKILLCFYDITSRREAERALQKSEMFLRTFIDNAPFEIWARDINNVGILENKMLIENFGSIIGRKPTDHKILDYEITKNWEKTNNEVLNGELIDHELEFDYNNKKINYHQIVFPIVIEDETIGVAGFNIDITERKKAQIALADSQEQLKNFAAHLQHIREEERILLAREIHDDLGQILVALKIDLGMLGLRAQKALLKETSEDFISHFQRLTKLVDNTIKTARRIMNNLRPEALDVLGLVESFRIFINSFQERYGIKCKLITDIDTIDIESQSAVALFRILQESMNNIAKHAMATEVQIRLGYLNKNTLYFEVIDNGVGFDINKKKRIDSYGMIGMKERVFLIEGNFTIDSEKGIGTKIRVELPLKPSSINS